MKDTIIKVGNKFISEEDYSYLVDADTKAEATLFTNDEADQIIAYLGEGEKELVNEEDSNNK